ncbi:hypothetical protein GCM10012320_35500 [Sinomonas cellulolyticus]|uniref:Uncharacterized protein n=1 Tax=Sinomonas cellulolyticus TaxID=2801916 RepID=A0ABS1K1C9_9MICC|nr:MULTISPECIES: hypothetical protein [Sinomonas]MBL0705112.1 hypothetical protein [Sinomonas cellulolyticus]GHG60791.1 hypothetical protein GCM10012320_35500 [Sinomonas sp. KCTC 49339]
MSTEIAWVIGLPADASYLGLVDDVRSAARRASKADPGDRLDIARFEALATRLEQAALNHPDAPRTAVSLPQGGQTMLFGTDPNAWPASLPDDIRQAASSLVAVKLLPVLVVDPHVYGITNAEVIGPAEIPADTWAAEDGVFGSRAVEARFRAQISEALDPDTTRRVPISPSGVNNAVVTEILREFVVTAPGTVRVDAPVEYRDGSRSAHPFPLRALPLVAELPPASLELKLALLSVRHTEMDAVVHGAWLRNAEISRPRPAGQTDDLVYDITLRQLEELCRTERHVRLSMYQTGLETAVVGFYRALTTHLLRLPGSVSVQPMYFVAPRRPRNDAEQQQSSNNGPRFGRPGLRNPPHTRRRNAQGDYSLKRSSPPEQKAVISENSTFRRGSVWST